LANFVKRRLLTIQNICLKLTLEHPKRCWSSIGLTGR
jgi:hypothetical protein